MRGWPRYIRFFATSRSPKRRTRCCANRSSRCRAIAISASPSPSSTARRSLSRDAVQELVTRHPQRAQQDCPSLKQKTVTPHVLRHSSAMRLRAHGGDQSVIALWLGHESVETTQMYLHADLRVKEQALSRVEPLGATLSRYRPEDDLLRFLERRALCRVRTP